MGLHIRYKCKCQQNLVSGGTLRWRAKQTREWLTRIEELGLVVLEQAENSKLRVLEPYKETDLNKEGKE